MYNNYLFIVAQAQAWIFEILIISFKTVEIYDTMVKIYENISFHFDLFYYLPFIYKNMT